MTIFHLQCQSHNETEIEIFDFIQSFSHNTTHLTREILYLTLYIISMLHICQGKIKYLTMKVFQLFCFCEPFKIGIVMQTDDLCYKYGIAMCSLKIELHNPYI